MSLLTLQTCAHNKNPKVGVSYLNTYIWMKKTPIFSLLKIAHVCSQKTCYGVRFAHVKLIFTTVNVYKVC
jgi:hypothetical protein